MLIYDLMGQTYYNDGKATKANYYHSRYAQN